MSIQRRCTNNDSKANSFITVYEDFSQSGLVSFLFNGTNIIIANYDVYSEDDLKASGGMTTLPGHPDSEIHITHMADCPLDFIISGGLFCKPRREFTEVETCAANMLTRKMVEHLKLPHELETVTCCEFEFENQFTINY